MQKLQLQPSAAIQTNDGILVMLNELLGKIYRAEQVYQGAIKDSNDSRLKDYFIGQAATRNRSAAQLENLILELGGTPYGRSSTTANAQRVWIDFIALFTGKKDQIILEDCLYIDKLVLQAYQEILFSNSLMEPAQIWMETQVTKLKDNLTTFQSVQDLM